MIMDDEVQQSSQEKKERKVQRERRYQSIVVTVLTGAVLTGGKWIVSTLWDISQSNGVVKSDIAEMRVQLSGAYRSDMARKDFETVNSRLSQLEKTNSAQDTKIDNIDRRVLLIETSAAIKGRRP